MIPEREIPGSAEIPWTTPSKIESLFLISLSFLSPFVFTFNCNIPVTNKRNPIPNVIVFPVIDK